MAMKRMILGGLLGGIAMFVWSGLAHMVLPLGEAGIQELPNEAALLSALRGSLGDHSALYLFPGMGLGPNPTGQQKQVAMQQYAQKLAGLPSGVLMYNPPGLQALAPSQFIVEFFKEIIEALLAVILLAQTRINDYFGRCAFVLVVGVVVAIGTNISYWNWYRFPATYTAAYMFTEIMGFLAAGLVVAALVKPAAQGRSSAAAR
jgi:hypothetical protein